MGAAIELIKQQKKKDMIALEVILTIVTVSRLTGKGYMRKVVSEVTIILINIVMGTVIDRESKALTIKSAN